MVKFAWPYASATIILCCGLAVYYLTAQHFGINGFAQFSLAKRWIAFLEIAFFQSFAIGLTYFIAKSQSESDSPQHGNYVMAGLVLVLAIQFALWAIASVCAEDMAHLFFGDAKLVGLVSITCLLLLGYSLHTIAHASWRGQFSMGKTSLLDVFNLGCLPLAAIALSGNSLERALWFMAIGTCGVSAAALVLILSTETIAIGQIKNCLEQLLRYAAPRLPGILASAGLLGLPAIVATHLYGLQVGGIVAFSGTLVPLAALISAPFNSAFMPFATASLSRGESARVQRVFLCSILGIISVSMLALLTCNLMAPWIVRYCLHTEAPLMSDIFRWMSWVLPAHAAFVSCRGLLDGATSRVLNTKNALLALMLFAVVTAITLKNESSPKFLLMGWVLSKYLQAGLSIFDTIHLLWPSRFSVRKTLTTAYRRHTLPIHQSKGHD